MIEMFDYTTPRSPAVLPLVLRQGQEARRRAWLSRRQTRRALLSPAVLMAAATLLLVLLAAVVRAQSAEKLGLDAPRVMSDACRSYELDDDGRWVLTAIRSSGQLCAVLEGSPAIKEKPKAATGRALRRLLARGLTFTYAVDSRGCVLIAPWGAMVDPRCRWERTETGAYVLRSGRRGSGDIYHVPGVTVREPAWAKRGEP